MFDGAIAFNQDLSGWDMSALRNVRNMFRGATSFDRDLGDWNVERLSVLTGFLKDGQLSTANYDALLLSWASHNVKENHGRELDLDAGNSTYCLGEASRQSLITNKQWTFVDGGKLCSVNVELSADFTQVEGNQVYVPKLLILGTLEVPATLSVIDTGTGSASTGVDYQFSSPFLITIPVGTYDGTLATAIDVSGLTILDDDLVEADETIILSLSQPSVNVVFGDTNNDGDKVSVFTYTIKNVDICVNDTQCAGLQVCNTTYNPAICQNADICGNNALESGEFCDDGNADSGDGCDENCTIENGFTCTSNNDCVSGLCDQSVAPFTCEEIDICGNGTIEMDEVCDDGNIVPSDGCDALCKLENGEECRTSMECASGICDGTLQPAKCEPSGACGNSTPEPGEGCDDGNTIIGDGCDENCKLEDENNCVGDRNCEEGLICNADRKCVLACQSDEDCDGKTCDSGQCINCADDTDCAASETCNLTNNQCEANCESDDECFPSGFCSETSSSCVECRDTLDCLSEEVCVEGICDGPACHPNDTNCDTKCEMKADCKNPRNSQCEIESKACVECLETSHCADGEICDRDFACKPACDSDANCADGKCSPDGQCVGCLTTADCENGECSAETLSCEIACEKSEECADGFYCTSQKRCNQGCDNDDDCTMGTCDMEQHECVKAPENKEKDEENPKLAPDGGCGCSSTTSSKFPSSLILFLGILLWSRKRKTK